MQFEFETVYTQKAVTAMARALRKTIRKKKNRRSCIFGSIISAAGLLLVIKSASEGEFFSFNAIVTLIAVIAMITAMIWQDAMNGYFVFLFSTSHAQVHDKKTLAGGSTEEFRKFIEETTGLKMQKV